MTDRPFHPSPDAGNAVAVLLGAVAVLPERFAAGAPTAFWPKRQERQKKQFNPISITWAMKDSRTDESADPWAAVMTKRTTTAIDHIATQVPPLELGKSVIISFQTTQI